MNPFYLVGEPMFKPDFERESFRTPLGQAKLSKEVAAETQDADEILERLRMEYLAIIYSLLRMGIEFRIVYAHEKLIDKALLNFCIRMLNCKMIGFGPDFFGPVMVFPRDFCSILPGIVLMNPGVATLTSDRKDGYALIHSPFGEGGRTLSSGKTMLVCEKVIEQDGQNRPIKNKEIVKLEKAGLRIAQLPTPFGCTIMNDVIKSIFTNDHIDRIGALLLGKNNQLHLVIDPQLCTAKWKKGGVPPWDVVGTEESIKKIGAICEPLGIKVHVPRFLSVPYSLNLIQFSDRRVLMTGGDDDVAEIVGNIVGDSNVCRTELPIKFFPVWMYGGIRCLINDAPLPILTKARKEFLT